MLVIMFDKNQHIKKRQHMTWIKGKPYQSLKKVLLIMYVCMYVYSLNQASFKLTIF